MLRCPLVRDDKRGAVIARLVIGLVTFVADIYLFLNDMIDADGIPYYFLYLTNWTGACTEAARALRLVGFNPCQLANPTSFTHLK